MQRVIDGYTAWPDAERFDWHRLIGLAIQDVL
jgi:hypothetical protein